MSLDIILFSPPPPPCACCGRPFPAMVAYDATTTSNLGKMASHAGIYLHLWHPIEARVTHAGQLIGPLHEGLSKLRADPDYFRQFDSPNGWGLYRNFVPWLERLLAACIDNPTARIDVSI